MQDSEAESNASLSGVDRGRRRYTNPAWTSRARLEPPSLVPETNALSVELRLENPDGTFARYRCGSVDESNVPRYSRANLVNLPGLEPGITV